MANNDGWQKLWTSEGKPYYQNEQTQQTQWDPPKGFIDDNSVQRQFEQYSFVTNDQCMEVYDNKGRSHWENKITGETSYDKPTAKSPSNPGNASAAQIQSNGKQTGNAPPFNANHNKSKNAVPNSNSSAKTTHGQIEDDIHAQVITWSHSPIKREPLSDDKKYYFICHVVTDILCLVAAYLCLSMPDEFDTIDNDVDPDAYAACQDKIDTVSGVGEAVLILTIMSMCICSVPYLCMIIYGKITDESLKNAVACFIFVVAAIGILWTMCIVILVYQIGSALTAVDCDGIEDVNTELIISMVLLIPSMFRIVIICCFVLMEHRGSV